MDHKLGMDDIKRRDGISGSGLKTELRRSGVDEQKNVRPAYERVKDIFSWENGKAAVAVFRLIDSLPCGKACKIDN